MAWTGICAVGGFTVGVLRLGQPAPLAQAAAASLIVGGLLRMKVFTPG